MDSIFKTCFYDSSGNISHVCVFCGDDTKTVEQFFSRSEYNELSSKNVKFTCSGLMIHIDDSIYDIKRKILYTLFEKEASEEDIPVCNYDELYLFGVTKKNFDLLRYYRNLTDSENIPLNLSLLGQSLVNYQINSKFDDEVLNLYKDNEIGKTLSYEDLQKITFFYSENNEKLCKIPLGQRFYTVMDDNTQLQNIDESFVTNPYDLWKNASINNKQNIQSFENDFLFHFGEMYNNTIHVALAEYVFDFAEQNNVDTKTLSTMYYPVLSKKGISSKESLIENKQELLKTSRNTFFDINHKTNFDKLSLFHNIFEDKKYELNYDSRGIQSFFIVLHPEDRSKKMPLENIYKHIHASIQIPFIQYNPGLRQENSYRIFFTEVSQNGKKIPYLPKPVFTQFLKKMNRVQNICLFVDQSIVNNQRTKTKIHVDDFVQLLLLSNGDIQIKGTLNVPLMPVEFNNWLTKLCDHALIMINQFLQQSGYFIPNFKSIYDSFVEVVDLQFICKIEMQELSFKKYMGCFSSLFYHELQSMKNSGVKLRYKRVENFKNMSPEDDMIANLLRYTQDKRFIATQLKRAFPNKDIKSMMQDYQSRHMNFIIPGRYVNKKMEILENPGFLTTFKRSGKIYTIEINGINLAQYLEVIPIYFDSILRMNIDPNILTKKQTELCKSNVIVQDDVEIKQFSMEERPIQIFEENKKEKGLLIEDTGDDDQDLQEKDSDSVEEDFDYGLDDYDEEDYDDQENDQDDKSSGSEEGSENDQEGGDLSDDEGDLQNTGKERITTYWGKKIQQHDPILFKVLKNGFTRLNQDEQPVLVSEEEMKQIDPSKYTHSLKYRKDKKGRPLHYICPRYWCTKPSMEGPISEEDAKSGKCGKIMNTVNDRTKDAPIGEYVIEYSGLNPEPGFVKSSKHQLTDENGDTLCAPKCFKKWETKAQKDARVLCSPEHYQPDKSEKDKQGQGKLVRPTDTYILESNSFPLAFGRIGKLPIPIQSFLSTNNENCIKDRKIKPNCPVLLRYGPEATFQGRQSFLSCLCDIYSFQENRIKDPFDLSQFKKILLESINFDLFIQLHNGSIASIFQPKNKDPDDVSTKDYEDSFFFSKIDKNDESQMSFLKHSILAFENFQKFINEDRVLIDHTYLWEVVSRPNKLLFKDGLNLAIMEMPEQDNTNNVMLLCPTNAYSYPIYDYSRKTVLLVKQTNENGSYYECVYRYRRLYNIIDGQRSETEDIKKWFSNKSKDVKGLATVMQLIRNVTDSKCKPKKPQTYEFQHNKTVIEIMNMLESIPEFSTIVPLSRVLNFQGKTIALMVDWKDKPVEVVSKGPFYLPCYPSTIEDKKLHVLWMDNTDLWTDYYSTVSFLRHVHAVSEQKIPVDPKFRVINQNMIIGVMTMSNQFIQIDQPIENIVIGDGLKPLTSSQYILSDKKMQTKIKPIKPMIVPEENKDSHFIFLETQFYGVFRSTIRILLNIYRNRFKYKQIMALHEDKDKMYRKKRKEVIEILKTIGDEHILFQDYDDKVLLSLYDIYNCQTNCKDKKYCIYKEDQDLCQILIPDKHLVTQESNKKIYYGRLADELLRHKRVHLFMFYPDSYLNISNTEVKVHDYEFIITDYELRNDYFKDLEPYPLQDYGRKTTYETSIPTTRHYPSKANWIEEFEKADKDLRT